VVRGECVAIIMQRDSRANSPLWNAFSLPRYTSGLPENLPAIEVGGKMNIGGLLAWEFLLMHWVEVRRWQVRAIFVMLVVVASALRRSVGPGSLLLPSPVSDALLPILTDDNCPNNHTNRTSRSREV